ncbi:MAG: efflux transporter outer membrane subunit [Capnocytophaga sp.]|nr:efflux transporter outer membrane subunit [Capnocytophaga sp.]
MKKSILKISLVAVSALVIASCAGRKVYERPEIVNENLYRTDNLPTDSLSAAAVSWKDVFTDNLLQGYIGQALENNLDIRMALQNVASSQAYLKQSKHAFLPTLSVSPSYTYNTASLNTQFGALIGQRTHLRQWDLTGSASWEADIWGKLNAQKKASYASYLGTVAAHQAVKSEIVATLATAYYQLLMYDKQQQILEETIVLRKQSFETTRSLKDAGSTTEVAVQQTEALLYNAEAQLITTKNAIRALENSICLLLGEEPHAIERNRLDSQQFPSAFNQGYAVSLLENRPDVIQAEYSLMNAFEMTNIARAAFYPSFTLSASGGFTSIDFDEWFSSRSIFASLVAGLTQPILNKRQIRTQYEVSQANQETALLNFKKTLLSAGKEVSDALQEFHSQDEFIVLKTKEMQAYQKATEYSKELFDSGMATYLDLITADVNRLSAELSVASAQFAKMQQGITLYKALGGGWR